MSKLTDDLRSMGRIIANARKSKGLTQFHASELLNLSYRHYQNIEAGRSDMKLSTLIKIQNLYSLPLSLFKSKFDKEEKTPPVVFLSRWINYHQLYEQA